MGFTVKCYGPYMYIFTVKCYKAQIFNVNCYVWNYSQVLQHILDTKYNK